MLNQAALKNIATDQLQMLSKLVTAEILLRVGTVVSPPAAPPGRLRLEDLRVGQRARFTDKRRVVHEITIVRVNTRTVSGKTDDPTHPGWKVPPHMLTLV